MKFKNYLNEADVPHTAAFYRALTGIEKHVARPNTGYINYKALLPMKLKKGPTAEEKIAKEKYGPIFTTMLKSNGYVFIKMLPDGMAAYGKVGQRVLLTHLRWLAPSVVDPESYTIAEVLVWDEIINNWRRDRFRLKLQDFIDFIHSQ